MRKVVLIIALLFSASLTFACTANFSYSAYPSGPLMLRYQFTNTSSYGTVGTHPTYQNVIYYGDGSYSSISNTGTMIHTYTSTGTYSVKLVIRIIDSSTGTLTCADSITKSVTVSFPACADSIYASYGSGGAVTFTTHSPSGATGSSHYWYFGDGTNGTGSPVTHTYTYNGTYNVYLTDTNTSLGCTYTTYTSITVTTGSWNCALDTARFYPSGSGPIISFYSTTRSPSGVWMRYKWAFGDGSSTSISTAYYTSHFYGTPGTYTAKLYTYWVDSLGTTTYCTDSTTHTFTVAGYTCSNDTARFTTIGTGYTITFNSPSRAPSPLRMRYKWYYGDGSSTTGYAYYVSHTYSSTGTYTAKLVTEWYDTSTSSVICSDSITHTVTTGWSCSLDTAKFAGYSSGLAWNFYSTTRPPSGVTMHYRWYFGDGGTYTSSSYYVTHTYGSAGTYTVKLITEWYDSATSSVVCSYSITHTYTVSVSTSTSNKISGYIYKDTLYSPTVADYKVWLVLYDSTTHLISAVDSTLDTGSVYTYYQFTGVSAGRYLVKAAITNGPTSGTAHVPSYHYNSAIWSTATYVNYTSGTTSGVNIIMQHGTVTGGPGFISGDVRYGAGKTSGVGDPVPNLLIMVQDLSGNLLSSGYTDAAGHYSITGLPLGGYVVYPEQLGYNTTASSLLNLSPFNPGRTGVDFKQTATEIKPNGAGVGNIPVSSQYFTVYPNPSQGNVTLTWNNTKGGAADINVTNVTGQRVYTDRINLDASGRSELHLGQLGAGTYFINIASGNDHYYQKLVIQK